MFRAMIIQRVRAYREERGLSQRAFAEEHGMNPETYKQWESGKRTPDHQSALLLAIILEEPALVERVAQALQKAPNDKPDAVPQRKRQGERQKIRQATA